MWDETALDMALRTNDDNLASNYPSLYLNIAKGYEDLEDFHNAKMNYELALSFTHLLSEDGYGRMIQSGINNGINRLAAP